MAFSDVRLTIKMSREYREFLHDLRQAGHFPNDSAMFEMAFRLLARAHGREAPPLANPIGNQPGRWKKTKIGS